MAKNIVHGNKTDRFQVCVRAAGREGRSESRKQISLAHYAHETLIGLASIVYKCTYCLSLTPVTTNQPHRDSTSLRKASAYAIDGTRTRNPSVICRVL